MKKAFFYCSRLISLLFLVFIAYSSDKKNYQKSDGITCQNLKIIKQVQDSITISVRFKSEGNMGFNIDDQYYHNYFIEFTNKTKKDTVIVKRIPNIFKNQLILASKVVHNAGKFDFYQDFFLISNTVNEYFFNYINDRPVLTNSKNTINANSIYAVFNKIDLKTKKLDKNNEFQKTKLKSELEQQYSESLLKAAPIEKELIETYYIYILQKIYPFDRKIDNYLKHLEPPIACNPFSSILFIYAKNRIGQINFNKLNETNYSKKYIELISIGIFNFLRFEENIGNVKYIKAKEWLIKSDLFKKDSLYIKKEITPKNYLQIQQNLEKLSFLDYQNNELQIGQVIKNKKSKYYLIDFWATWCAPCIQNISKIHQMALPKSLEIIYISMDKSKDKEKWVLKSKELNLKNSYFVVKNESNKTIIKEIELNQLPRYILVNNNFKIIDNNMITPQEGDFLKSLKRYIKQ